MKAYNVNSLSWPFHVHLFFLLCSMAWEVDLFGLHPRVFLLSGFPLGSAEDRRAEGDQVHSKYLPAPSQTHHGEVGVGLLSSGPGNHFIFLPLKPRDSHSSHVPVRHSSPSLLIPFNPAGIFANHLLVEPNSFPVCVCHPCPLGSLTNRAESWGI